MPSKEGRATLASVAASAGVSVATVSKVLNGRSDVAPATRALVQRLLQQHDYVARRGDGAARSAAERTSPTVELVFQGRLNAYSTEIIEGVLEAASTEHDVFVVISVRTASHRTGSNGNEPSPAAWARRLAAAGRLAVVAVTDELTNAHLQALSRARLPLVVIDPLNLTDTRVHSVGATNFAGGLAAAEHLLSLGHRRIAFLGGWPNAACNQARLQGYRAAMDAAGLPVPVAYVRSGRYLYDDGLEQGAALLELPEPPTAVFASSDETALGVIEAARSRGLRIPEDLSVIGFDDTQVARLSSPPLTTVRQPLREIGRVALRRAMRLAAGETVDSHHIELATELVVRHSTAPAGT